MAFHHLWLITNKHMLQFYLHCIVITLCTVIIVVRFFTQVLFVKLYVTKVTFAMYRRGRSSLWKCFIKIFIKSFSKLTEHQYQSLFSNNIVGLQPAILLQKKLWQRYSLVNFAEFLEKPLLLNTSVAAFKEI